MGIIAVIAAGVVALAQAAGQSIAEWISGPQGQQFINDTIKRYGPDLVRLVLEKLGVKL